MRIRPESVTDNASVEALIERAFGSAFEARIVARLRDSASAFASLVAEDGGAVVGHALFTLVTVEHPDAMLVATALGPVAVTPERQRAGIGDALVRAGIAQARAGAHPGVFVLGHPAYYPRFGFEPAAKWGFFYGPPERAEDHADSFFVLPFDADLLGRHVGRVRYHAVFEGG